ncbi:hypothetical protein GLAREA_08003 [Glarea lozoyensis ATCC 20868]|uniref:Hydrophobin n=1 Tax=Glarea lozoyensis (strain ATCC 20868 / MF5171) TaxID=1116229 RepID=S3DBW7_GLAL2|nr:uncharacterized protein GLAREA_08003 [Glarea lozoyensis ATCC 20868]EPE24153.1 hypothetical protein GLAREA_08003 [Glarea lozoyensis ATCC 20868]
MKTSLAFILTALVLPFISAAPVEQRTPQSGPGIIVSSPNGQECTGASDGVSLGSIVGNVLGCGGVGGILGGK